MTRQSTIYVFGTLIVLLVGGAIYSLYYYPSPPAKESFVPVSGVIMNPVTTEPVSGVDLVSGDTRVRTGETGQFAFGSVSSFAGMRLTHPNLLRAFHLVPPVSEPEGMTVYFDESLLNTLVTIVDREARGKLDIVYEQLLPSLQARLTEAQFIAAYESIYAAENITDQELTITEMTYTQQFTYTAEDETFQFTDVYTFTLRNGAAEKQYHFVLQSPEAGIPDEAQWYLIP